MNGSLLSVKSGLAVVTAAVSGWEFGKYLEENFLEAKLGGIALVDGILSAWERIKQGAQVSWLYVEKVVSDSIDNIKLKIASLLDDAAKIAQYGGNLALAIQFEGLSQAISKTVGSSRDYAKEISDVNTQSDKAVSAIHETTSAMADDAIAAFKAGGAHKVAADAVKDAGDKAKQATPNFNGLAKAMTDAEKQAEKLAKDGVELASFLDQLSSKTADKHTKAWAEYGAAIEKINALSAKFIKDGMDQARVQQFISDATQLATRSLRE